jgi:hypothetical protein
MARQLEALAEQGFSAYAVAESGDAVNVKPLTARRGHE